MAQLSHHIPMVSLCVVLLPLVFIARATFLSRRYHKKAREHGCLPPLMAPCRGLWGLGLLQDSMRATREEWGPVWIHKTINEMGDGVHTVGAHILDYRLFITRDTENVKAIFNTQSADFDIGPHRERTFKTAFGLGIMTARGDTWKHSRGLLRPQFTRKNLANIDIFERHVQSLLEHLETDSNGWTQKLDMQPMFQRLTLEVGVEFLFGPSAFAPDNDARARTTTFPNPNLSDVAQFGHHLDNVKRILDQQGAMAKYSWLLRSTTFSKHCESLRIFVDRFVRAALARQRKTEACGAPRDVDGKFVLLDELTSETQDPVRLRSETLNVLHASRDTTAALMGWVMYFVARHPAVATKLRSEVMETFPDHDPSSITLDKLQRMSYMQWVINETLRMAAVVPMNERAAVRDTTLPRGGGPDGQAPIFVPKGCQILVPTYSMQHCDQHWGGDHDEFKPERWRHRKFGWDFIPFGSGPRQCLGQQFAKAETIYLIVRLFQNFDRVENVEPEGSSMRFHHTIENRSGSGVQVRLCAAKRVTKTKTGTYTSSPGTIVSFVDDVS